MNDQPQSSRGIYPGSILIKLTQDPIGLTTLSTYCRALGSKGRITMDTDDLLQWLGRDNSTYEKRCYDRVCNDHHISIMDVCDILHVTVAWLDRDAGNGLTGCRQDFRIQKNEILPFLRQAEKLNKKAKLNLLYVPYQRRSAEIDVSRALPTLRRVISVPKFRRAFSKAMRDCFKWPADIVTLFPDGRLDFVFSTASGIPETGGLILHTDTIHRKTGDYQRNKYHVHT